jgi:hypothetical protein
MGEAKARMKKGAQRIRMVSLLLPPCGDSMAGLLLELVALGLMKYLTKDLSVCFLSKDDD